VYQYGRKYHRKFGSEPGIEPASMTLGRGYSNLRLQHLMSASPGIWNGSGFKVCIDKLKKRGSLLILPNWKYSREFVSGFCLGVEFSMKR